MPSFLTGAGDKAFNAGADISGDLSESEETSRMVNRALLKTSSYPKPIIAAVNGVCAGGGVELMLSSDIRYAVPHARFGLPEVQWAIYPFGGATAKLINQNRLCACHEADPDRRDDRCRGGHAHRSYQ